MKTQTPLSTTPNGFTLLEMLIYVALVATVMSSVVFFGIWVIQVGVKSRINSEVMGNARSAMETMVYEIKKSQSVYAPTSVFDSSLGQLSLEQTKDAGSDESSGFIDFFILIKQRQTKYSFLKSIYSFIKAS